MPGPISDAHDPVHGTVASEGGVALDNLESLMIRPLTLEECVLGLRVTDPQVVNEYAFAAHLLHIEAAGLAADRDDTFNRFEVATRLKETGQATSDKAAEQLAKNDPEHVAYCEETVRLKRRRDIAEAVRDALKRRFWSLYGALPF